MGEKPRGSTWRQDTRLSDCAALGTRPRGQRAVHHGEISQHDGCVLAEGGGDVQALLRGRFQRPHSGGEGRGDALTRTAYPAVLHGSDGALARGDGHLRPEE